MSAQTSHPLRLKLSLATLLTICFWLVLLSKIFIFYGDPTEMILDVCLFVVSVPLGIFLIYSLYSQSIQKEELSNLAIAVETNNVKKDEFINMAAHELRAPLTAVKGFLSMVIAGDSGTIGEKTKEFLIDSAVSTQRMIRLVNNMLNVNRIEDGRMMFNMENFHLALSAQKVHDEFQFEAVQKGLALQLEISKNASDLIYADSDHIEEVMVNFLSNAIKYTSTGQVVMKLHNPTPHAVRFEVIDTGSGITKLEQKRLFQKFYRVEAKVGKTIGTGLGLYISKLIIKKFGGAIGVVSEEGKGSTFWFELPVKSNVSV